MTLAYLLAIIGITLVLIPVAYGRGRTNLFLVISALAVFALQPSLPIRGLDFWLPVATLSLAVLSWALTVPPDQRKWRSNWPAAAILAGVVLALGLTRLLSLDLPFTASRPPQTFQILIVIVIVTAMVIAVGLFKRIGAGLVIGFSVLILSLFAVLKMPALGFWASSFFRSLNGQNLGEASILDLRWLGFSYIAFRLLHTLRDRQTGRLPAVGLAEYVVYIVFFPTITAGPIDRIERFVVDLRTPSPLSPAVWLEAGKRLVTGLFKKFVIADSLALFSLNGTNALQVHSSGWMWVLVYSFAFQIFFDFSGYTDIAIGLGGLLGINLPENFSAPYLKNNLTQFWNNWHMTLTQWFRAYFFNPLTRALRSIKRQLPISLVIFITQMSTMVLIGLWHGMTLNFILWGLWHGIGLFIHNRWSDLTKVRFAALPSGGQKALNVGGTLLTFHFVALGWVFFAIPQPAVSLQVLKTLFGLG